MLSEAQLRDDEADGEDTVNDDDTSVASPPSFREINGLTCRLKNEFPPDELQARRCPQGEEHQILELARIVHRPLILVRALAEFRAVEAGSVEAGPPVIVLQLEGPAIARKDARLRRRNWRRIFRNEYETVALVTGSRDLFEYVRTDTPRYNDALLNFEYT
jgi:hypothetical protein